MISSHKAGFIWRCLRNFTDSRVRIISFSNDYGRTVCKKRLQIYNTFTFSPTPHSSRLRPIFAAGANRDEHGTKERRRRLYKKCFVSSTCINIERFRNFMDADSLFHKLHHANLSILFNPDKIYAR